MNLLKEFMYLPWLCQQLLSVNLMKTFKVARVNFKKNKLPHIIDSMIFCLISKEFAIASLQNSAIDSTHRNISIFQW